MANCDKRQARKKKKRKKGKMGKKDNKGAVRDLVESGAVRDMGWEEKGLWRWAEYLVKSWKKKQIGMRLVELQE
jgi:hypothetical protein